MLDAGKLDTSECNVLKITMFLDLAHCIQVIDYNNRINDLKQEAQKVYLFPNVCISEERERQSCFKKKRYLREI